ncbi:hypothetical protein [Streptomyces synnematoformans]
MLALGGALLTLAAPADATARASAEARSAAWAQSAPRAQALPPPHEPDRGSCTATRSGQKIQMDCIIKKPDTTLWVACSGGFVEIRHRNPPGFTASGTCPQYGGYALTFTSPD